jgi:methyl-accepting chemotaxis protein
MLATLVPDIQKTTRLIEEISAASKEQNSGAEQSMKHAAARSGDSAKLDNLC